MVAVSTLTEGDDPLIDEERGEPDGEERGLRDRAPRDRDRACNRDELEQPRAPEVLAEAEELMVQLVDVERDEVPSLLPPRELRRVRRRRLRRGGEHCRVEREHRDPGPPVLPHGERHQRRDERDPELEHRAPPSCEREGDERREDEEAVRRLQRDREPCHEPCGDDVAPRSAVERAQHEDRGDHQQHHRREVAERREAERLRQRLLVPTLVVAPDEERLCRERRHDPGRCREVAEEPSPDAGRDPVRAEDGDRHEHEQLQAMITGRPSRKSGPARKASGASTNGQR